METLYTTPGDWISIKKHGNFYWSERAGVNSIGVIAVRETNGTPEVLVHTEYNPAQQKNNIGAIGGCIDKDIPLAEIAQEELKEEAGYYCPLQKIQAVGEIFCTTQSSERVFLFVADLTGIPFTGLKLEPEEENNFNKNEWRRFGKWIYTIEDPRFVTAITRWINNG